MAITVPLSDGVPTSNIRLPKRFHLETLGTCYLTLQDTSTLVDADSSFDQLAINRDCTHCRASKRNRPPKKRISPPDRGVDFLSRPLERPLMKTTKLARSYRIDDGKHFRLKDFDPADTGH